VILFLAARLENPAPLLERLSAPEPTTANPAGDDFLRHRLALAARCLAELSPAACAALTPLVDRITAEAFSSWWRGWMEQPELARAAPLARARRPLGEVNGRLAGMPLCDWLAAQLGAGDPRARRAAAEAVGEIGSAAATPAVLDGLAATLASEEFVVRHAALEAARRLGSAAARPPVLDRLALLTRDREWRVRQLAARLASAFGPAAAASPAVRAGLAALQRDEDPRVRQAAGADDGRQTMDDGRRTTGSGTSTVGHWSPSAVRRPSSAVGATLRPSQSETGLDHLAEDLGSSEERVRRAAAERVMRIGPAAATPAILERLAALLEQSGRRMPAAALGAIRSLGPAAATDRISTALVRLVLDENAPLSPRAGSTLAELVQRGVRVFQRADGRWEAHTIEALARWPPFAER
jgi:HEAT repeat protein